MIQRIQTLYLFVASVCSSVLIFVYELWENISQSTLFIVDNMYVFIGFVVSILLSLISIFSFKNRKSQFIMGRLNILLNFILLGLFVSKSLNVSGETSVSEKGIWMLLLIVSIVCLALANKAIKKDEDLVKSVDRLR